MYVPKLYREEDRATLVAFLQHNNFPALVTFDSERPIATHLVVEVAETDSALTIYGHLSRANPQWRTIGTQEALLIFQGAHTYISPRWYDHINVPTWNYLMAHVYGPVRELEGDELHALLSRLVQHHEANSTYRLETLPPDFVQKEMKGIYGFALTVTRLEGGDDCPVLVDVVVLPVLGLPSLGEQPAADVCDPEGIEEPRECLVAGRGGDRKMEGPARVVHLVRALRRLLGSDRRAHRIEVGVSSSRSGESCDLRLECEPRFEPVAHVVEPLLGDEEPAVDLEVDEPVAREPAQGLAHRAP